jgi:PAS domain S-box-containing protein
MAKILVIDDEESIRYTFANFLSEEGHEAVTACNYAEGAAQISACAFDLIFSDIILGGRTGVDILRGVRERSLVCPVVMVTGYPTVETAAEAVRLGAFDYLQKPVEQDTLLHITRLALEHKKVLDENERYRVHLDAIFTSVEDGIVSVDNGLMVLEVNEAAEKICGLNRDQIGRDLQASSMHCKEKFVQALKKTVESRTSVRIERFECSHGPHALKILTLTAYPLVDRQGLFRGAVMVVRDETRLASLEQDLKDRSRFHNINGKSEQMQKVYSLIDSLANIETTVLITGESGTGKELVAEALHFMGARSHQPLVKVNCSALSENLLESELFGHAKGAFTGAVSDRIGRFQKADKGSIFLDEIGDISPKVQSSLLRVLQEKEFERVGESKPVRVDVRVIAATNKNLEEEIEKGTFREDLYFRLAVIPVHVPPLRERSEDVPPLVRHYMEYFARENNVRPKRITPAALDVLQRHRWKGNIRELRNTVERLMIMTAGDTIDVADLPDVVRSPAPVGRGGAGSLEADAARGGTLREFKDNTERSYLVAKLRENGWNISKTAEAIDTPRSNLYKKLEQYQISQEADG